MNEWYCKWVGEDMKTRNNTKWEVGVPKELPEKEGLVLHEEGLFHYFSHPLLAALLKTSFWGEIQDKLYEVKPEGKVIKNRILCGATKLTLVKELEVPDINETQRIAFGILCALKVCKEKKFISWANDWLSGKDRSMQSANVVFYYMRDVHSKFYSETYDRFYNSEQFLSPPFKNIYAKALAWNDPTVISNCFTTNVIYNAIDADWAMGVRYLFLEEIKFNLIQVAKNAMNIT